MRVRIVVVSVVALLAIGAGLVRAQQPLYPDGVTAVPADYDGDGIVDIAIFEKAEGIWKIDNSFGGRTTVQWGNADDIPVPGDYDGDFRADIAVYRPSDGVFYIRYATGVMAGVVAPH